VIRRLIRYTLIVAGALALGYRTWHERAAAPAPVSPSLPPSALTPPSPRPSVQPSSLSPPFSDPAILAAIRDQRSHIWGEAAGVVSRLIKDDTEGSPHQRFLVRLESGTTLLVAYNLELAPRIAPLAVGDTLVLRGEYLWNDKGGVMHWVHRDPSGKQPGGWVRVHGQEFR